MMSKSDARIIHMALRRLSLKSSRPIVVIDSTSAVACFTPGATFVWKIPSNNISRKLEQHAGTRPHCPESVTPALLKSPMDAQIAGVGLGSHQKRLLAHD